jgi:hypothetical protein
LLFCFLGVLVVHHLGRDIPFHRFQVHIQNAFSSFPLLSSPHIVYTTHSQIFHLPFDANRIAASVSQMSRLIIALLLCCSVLNGVSASDAICRITLPVAAQAAPSPPRIVAGLNDVLGRTHEIPLFDLSLALALIPFLSLLSLSLGPILNLTYSDTALIAAAKSLRIGTLRYPGGTVANYWSIQVGRLFVVFLPFALSSAPFSFQPLTVLSYFL